MSYLYIERPHQGLGNLTPYEKLKSLGYVTGEAICLFPPLILDSVCCLDPFTIKKKSVQDHLDHDPNYLQKIPLTLYGSILQRFAPKKSYLYYPLLNQSKFPEKK